MALTLSDHPWRQWSVRAVAAWLLVWMLGGLGFPRLAYTVVLVLAGVDAVRVALQNRAATPRPTWKSGRGETIH